MRAIKSTRDTTPLELLVLREPERFERVLDQRGHHGGHGEASRVEKLVERFDAMPFKVACKGSGCGRAATRCTVYGENTGYLCWWCDACDPHQQGALRGKLSVVATYRDALRHVRVHCRGRQADYRRLVRALAEAKGLPWRVGAREARAFFCSGDGDRREHMPSSR
jgi:hypothetical protein